jgi:outer membrane protein assembly factor BamB
MQTRRQYGEGSSPALYGDRLIVNWDHEGDSFLLVLDKNTGKEVWRQPRTEVTSWSTPIVVEVGGLPQVVVNATTASRGYELKSGKVIWCRLPDEWLPRSDAAGSAT